MKLYYGLTNYHLLCCVLHKIIYNSDETAIFVASQGILKSRIENLKKYKIFDSVYFLEDTILRNNAFLSLSSGSTDIEIDSEISKFVVEYEKFLPFDLKSFDDLYIAADHGVLGLYILAKKYRYNYMEDGRGIYSNWETLDNLLKIKNPTLEVVCSHLNAYGKSEQIIKRYIAFDSQKERFDSTTCVDFRVDELLKKLSQKEIDTILKIFQLKAPKIDINSRNALILTQRFSTYHMLTEEENILLYALLADFFASDCNIYLKPHPADKSEYIKMFFKDNIIDKEIPSELLRIIIRKRFDIGICTYSSSINSLKDCINDIYDIDESIVNYPQNIFKIYALFELAKNVHATITNNDDKIFKMFEQFYQLKYKRSISYINNKSKSDIIVSNNFFEGANLAMQISIINQNLDFIFNIPEEEIIYMNATTPKIRNEILNFKMERLLKISKLRIKIKVIKI